MATNYEKLSFYKPKGRSQGHKVIDLRDSNVIVKDIINGVYVCQILSLYFSKVKAKVKFDNTQTVWQTDRQTGKKKTNMSLLKLVKVMVKCEVARGCYVLCCAFHWRNIHMTDKRTDECTDCLMYNHHKGHNICRLNYIIYILTVCTNNEQCNITCDTFVLWVAILFSLKLDCTYIYRFAAPPYLIKPSLSLWTHSSGLTMKVYMTFIQSNIGA